MTSIIRALLTFTLSIATTVCAAEQIIVYRSRAEAEMDAFWWDNPELALVFVGVLIAIPVGFWIYRTIRNRTAVKRWNNQNFRK